jgi:hypothetical protein
LAYNTPLNCFSCRTCLISNKGVTPLMSLAYTYHARGKINGIQNLLNEWPNQNLLFYRIHTQQNNIIHWHWFNSFRSSLTFWNNLFFCSLNPSVLSFGVIPSVIRFHFGHILRGLIHFCSLYS